MPRIGEEEDWGCVGDEDVVLVADLLLLMESPAMTGEEGDGRRCVYLSSRAAGNRSIRT